MSPFISNIRSFDFRAAALQFGKRAAKNLCTTTEQNKAAIAAFGATAFLGQGPLCFASAVACMFFQKKANTLRSIIAYDLGVIVGVLATLSLAALNIYPGESILSAKARNAAIQVCLKNNVDTATVVTSLNKPMFFGYGMKRHEAQASVQVISLVQDGERTITLFKDQNSNIFAITTVSSATPATKPLGHATAAPSP